MTHLVQGLTHMENATNYNDWIFNNINSFLGNRILEVGGGLGIFTERLLDREFVATVEIHQELAAHLKNKFKDNNINVFQGDICDKDLISNIKDLRIDTVVCLNVLEHIEDDALALSNMNKCLSPNGRLILFVPALRFLFGAMDKSQHHYRRYNKNSLKKLVNNMGFSIIKSYYMNSLGVIGWFIFGKIFKRSVVSQRSVLFYDKYVVPWLSKSESIFHPFIGQSLLLICKKEN
ncbi:class I SAM-dependent methyltransferase [Candidatus Margulisiibacteriota bacterium]